MGYTNSLFFGWESRKDVCMNVSILRRKKNVSEDQRYFASERNSIVRYSTFNGAEGYHSLFFIKICSFPMLSIQSCYIREHTVYIMLIAITGVVII